MSDFQLTLPRLGSSLGLGQSPYDRVMTGQLQLDPAIEALIYPVQFYLPPTTPDGPPILNITAALTTLADPTKPSLRLGGPVPILQTRDGLPWTVPNPKMRAATSDDVTAAVMGIPQVKSAVTRVEGLASAELARTWKDIRGNKASWPVLGVWTLSVGFMAFKAADAANPKLKFDKEVKLDSLPKWAKLPVPGLSVEFKYDGDFRTLVRDPAAGKELAGFVKLDLAELIPALK